MLDTLREVETPEGIQLSLPVAGPVVRARAWLFDMVLRIFVWIFGSIVLGLLGRAGTGLSLIFLFALNWLYPVLFEVLREGQTPGKRIAGLRVVHDDGMPVGWSASLIRSLIGFVDMLPFGYAAGLVCSLLHRDCKRLGDLAAGTLVVYAAPQDFFGGLPQVAPRRPPVPLRIDEQYNLVQFAARAGNLTRQRLDELARIAEPLTSTAEPVDGLTQLLGQARWISGDR